jgi:hypothetical protein
MTRAEDFLKQAKLYSDGNDYLMVSLPPQAIMVAAGILAEIGDPFGAVIADKDEVTLIMPAEVYEEFQTRMPTAKPSLPMRLITLDIELPPDLIGFMALVAQKLADAGIPIIPLGAFQRDHVLVPADRFEDAWKALGG